MLPFAHCLTIRQIALSSVCILPSWLAELSTSILAVWIDIEKLDPQITIKSILHTGESQWILDMRAHFTYPAKRRHFRIPYLRGSKTLRSQPVQTLLTWVLLYTTNIEVKCLTRISGDETAGLCGQLRCLLIDKFPGFLLRGARNDTSRVCWLYIAWWSKQAPTKIKQGLWEPQQYESCTLRHPTWQTDRDFLLRI